MENNPIAFEADGPWYGECQGGTCGEKGVIAVGVHWLCPRHAAETLLQLAALPLVQQALAAQGKAVLILDQVEHEDIEHLQMLLHHSMVRTDGPAALKQRLLDWCEDQLAAINKTRTE